MPGASAALKKHQIFERIKRRVESSHERAYGIRPAPLPSKRSGVRTSIRSEIRRWTTQWDFQRPRK